MMRTRQLWVRIFRFILLLLILVSGFITIVGTGGGGGGGDDTPPPPTPPLALGNWSGNDISFTLASGSYLVKDLSVTYRGHAAGTLCSYNYTTTVTIGTSLPVDDDNSFHYQNSTLEIHGTFTDGNSVVVDVSWSEYDPNCNATKSGSAVCSADHHGDFVIDGFLQYRSYSNAGNNQYRGWVDFTRGGTPIQAADIAQIVLKTPAGSPVNIDNTIFWSATHFWGEWNDATSSVDFSGPSSYAGFTVNFPDTTSLSEGTYTYEATTDQGQVLTLKKYFPGETVLPVVDSASMNYEWLGDAGLRLTWANPVGSYDELRIVLYDQDGDDLLYVKLPADKEELVIPGEWIRQIAASLHPVSAGWEVQTRAYTATDDHNNYARGISDRVSFPWEEDNNHPSTATPISTDGTLYPENIDYAGDIDYFSFEAVAGDTYVIETSNLGGGCDTVITLYDTNGTTELTEDDDGATEPLASRIEWNFSTSGTYYVRVREYNPEDTGSYFISVNRSVWTGAAGFGEIEFVVTPDGTGITKIKITFVDFSCGGFTTNGSITFTRASSPWPISNDQFTAVLNWTSPNGDREMTIQGTFDSPTHAAGTYEADYGGSLCPGIWEATAQ